MRKIYENPTFNIQPFACPFVTSVLLPFPLIGQLLHKKWLIFHFALLLDSEGMYD